MALALREFELEVGRVSTDWVKSSVVVEEEEGKADAVREEGGIEESWDVLEDEVVEVERRVDEGDEEREEAEELGVDDDDEVEVEDGWEEDGGRLAGLHWEGRFPSSDSIARSGWQHCSKKIVSC